MSLKHRAPRLTLVAAVASLLCLAASSAAQRRFFYGWDNYGRPVFRGIYEDNNPRGRLMVMVNYNTDVSQYWEWSGRGFRPFDDTNEAYKLAVNYLMYGLTH